MAQQNTKVQRVQITIDCAAAAAQRWTSTAEDVWTVEVKDGGEWVPAPTASGDIAARDAEQRDADALYAVVHALRYA